MQPVETHFEEGNFHYEQLSREGDLAIYRQSHRHGAMVRFEVVRIRPQPAHTWPDGRTSPERETYPGASRWGSDGWTCTTLAEAQQLLGALRA
jgi:hypothetical protein